MKILITTDWYSPTINGVVTSVNNLRSGLERKGHEVRILTLRQSQTAPEENGVYIIPSISAGKIYPEARIAPHVSRELLENIYNWHPDIVHSQCEFSTFLPAKKIAKYLHIPLIHTYHTVYEDYRHYFSTNIVLSMTVVKKLTKSILGKTDCVIAPTEKIRKMLVNYGVNQPIEVIPTGIELEKYKKITDEHDLISLKKELNIPQGTLILLFVGRLADEKNIDELLRYSALLNKNPMLLIVGDGPDKVRLEKLALELGIADRVRFVGMICPDEIPKYYHAADLFVSASTSETQGLTYIEALASGLPLLCRKDLCLEGILKNGVNGYQYTDFQSFFHFIEKEANNPSILKLLKNNASIEVQSYSIDSFTDHILSVYRYMLEHVPMPYYEPNAEIQSGRFFFIK